MTGLHQLAYFTQIPGFQQTQGQLIETGPQNTPRRLVLIHSRHGQRVSQLICLFATLAPECHFAQVAQ